MVSGFPTKRGTRGGLSPLCLKFRKSSSTSFAGFLPSFVPPPQQKIGSPLHTPCPSPYHGPHIGHPNHKKIRLWCKFSEAQSELIWKSSLELIPLKDSYKIEIIFITVFTKTYASSSVHYLLPKMFLLFYFGAPILRLDSLWETLSFFCELTGHYICINRAALT